MPNQEVNYPEDIRIFDYTPKISKPNFFMILALTIISVFSVATFVSNEVQKKQYYKEQYSIEVEKKRIQDLSFDLYKKEHYTVTDYKVGTCEGKCTTSTFTTQQEIKSCDPNVHIQIKTLVQNPVSITVKVGFRVVNIDTSFAYLDEKSLITGPSSVEQRLKEITLYATRPPDWFCLPPGKYQEQATIEYSYSNELGTAFRSPVIVSQTFTVK